MTDREADKVLEEQAAEIVRLRAALAEIELDALSCMEGTGDPAFSDYERIAGMARRALRGGR